MEYPFLGVRQMCYYLKSLGYSVGSKRIRRLMRIMGIMAIYQKPRTSIPEPMHKRYPYLLRELKIEKSNQVWCAGDCPKVCVNLLSGVNKTQLGDLHKLWDSLRFIFKGSCWLGFERLVRKKLTTQGFFKGYSK